MNKQFTRFWSKLNVGCSKNVNNVFIFVFTLWDILVDIKYHYYVYNIDHFFLEFRLIIYYRWWYWYKWIQQIQK